MKDVIQKLAQDIFDKGYFLSLATLDDGGLWVSDVSYIADNHWNIYWLSARDTRHSKAILQNPNVAGTITITMKTEDPSEALQIAGRAEIVTEDKSGEVEELFSQKRGKEKKSNADRNNARQAWYKLAPTKIRLSHQETFGFEKQDVEIQ